MSTLEVNHIYGVVLMRAALMNSIEKHTESCIDCYEYNRTRRLEGWAYTKARIVVHKKQRLGVYKDVVEMYEAFDQEVAFQKILHHDMKWRWKDEEGRYWPSVAPYEKN